jgi:predicted RND superfamily exporter protein
MQIHRIGSKKFPASLVVLFSLVVELAFAALFVSVYRWEQVASFPLFVVLVAVPAACTAFLLTRYRDR